MTAALSVAALPEYVPQQWRSIISQCRHPDPLQRPTLPHLQLFFLDLLQDLRQAKRAAADPKTTDPKPMRSLLSSMLQPYELSNDLNSVSFRPPRSVLTAVQVLGSPSVLMKLCRTSSSVVSESFKSEVERLGRLGLLVDPRKALSSWVILASRESTYADVLRRGPLAEYSQACEGQRSF